MTFRENNQRITNPTGPVELLEITNAAFSAPLRIANDAADVVSQGVTYVAGGFSFKLPEDVAGGAPRMQIGVSNRGTGITSELEGLPPGTRTMAKLIIIDRGAPDVHEHTYWLPITRVTCTPSEVTATAGVDEVMRQSACRQIASPHALPGLF